MRMTMAQKGNLRLPWTVTNGCHRHGGLVEFPKQETMVLPIKDHQVEGFKEKTSTNFWMVLHHWEIFLTYPFYLQYIHLRLVMSPQIDSRMTPKSGVILLVILWSCPRTLTGHIFLVVSPTKFILIWPVVGSMSALCPKNMPISLVLAAYFASIPLISMLWLCHVAMDKGRFTDDLWWFPLFIMLISTSYV